MDDAKDGAPLGLLDDTKDGAPLGLLDGSKVGLLDVGTGVGDNTGRDEALLKKVGDGDFMIVLLVALAVIDAGVAKLLVFIDISGVDWIVVPRVV